MKSCRAKQRPQDKRGMRLLDRHPHVSIKSSEAMMKRLATITLITLLCGSVLTGAPLHAGEQNQEACPMGDMMDCCQSAQSTSNMPEVAAARLCCLINCQQTGIPAASASALPSVSLPATNAFPSATIQSPDALQHIPLRGAIEQTHQSHASPEYIRHLALLI